MIDRSIKYYIGIIFFLLGVNSGTIISAQDTINLNVAPTEIRSFDEDEMDKYKSDEDFEYADQAQYEESLYRRAVDWLKDFYQRWLGAGASMIEKLISWGLCIVVLVAVILFFTNTSSHSIFRPNMRQSKIKAEIFDEAIDVTNISEAIEKAENEGLYREAVRYRYIQILFLSEKRDYLQLDKYKTVEDYKMEFKDVQMRPSFFDLSRAFEFFWYGDYDLDLEQYNQQKKAFLTFINQLESNRFVLETK